MEDIQKRIGRNIRELRTAAGFAQDGFAERAGINRTQMGQIEASRFGWLPFVGDYRTFLASPGTVGQGVLRHLGALT